MENEKIKTQAIVIVDDVLDLIPTGSLLAELKSRGTFLEEVRSVEGRLLGYCHTSTEGDPDALAAKREQLMRSQADLKEEELRRHTHAGPDKEGETGPPADGSSAPTIDPLIYEAALELSYRVGLIGHKEYLDAKIEAMRARRDKEGGA